MRLRPLLATAATALLLLTGGLTEATAAESPATPVVQVDDDADDLDTGTLTNPTPATVDAPSEFSTLGDPPNFNNCRQWGTYWGETCFQWVGDVQWVKDNITNGWTTAFHVQTNYGKDRYCGAPKAADGWGYCNYNHIEGKCVRWRSYELWRPTGETRNFTVWSAWYGTEYGSLC